MRTLRISGPSAEIMRYIVSLDISFYTLDLCKRKLFHEDRILDLPG